MSSSAATQTQHIMAVVPAMFPRRVDVLSAAAPVEVPWVVTGPAAMRQSAIFAAPQEYGAVMAPNFLYTNRAGQEVFTEVYNPAKQPTCGVLCADAITRGLLWGLTPIITMADTVLPLGTF